MPEFTGQIENGARVRVRFTPEKMGGTPVTGMALIDTGASLTHIDRDTAEAYGFRRLESLRIYTASQSDAEAPTYDAVVEILDIPGHRERLQAIGFPAPPPPDEQPAAERFIALIGWDILDRGRFIYDGAADTFTLDLP